MDDFDGIGELFTHCPNCNGVGCEACRGSGVVLSEKGRQAEMLGSELLRDLPAVSREDVSRIVKKLRAQDRGIRVVTEDGELVPDPFKRPRR